MIAVVGASSSLGSRVVRRLVAQGAQVRAASRDPRAKLAGAADDGVEAVAADLRDPASLHRVVAGAETVVSCAHALVPPDRRNRMSAVDRDGVCSLIDAAREAGVGRVVLTSVLGASAQAPAVFVRMKWAAEEHLRQSGMDAAVIRPTVFMETHVLLMLGEPLRSTGQVQVFGRGETRLNFVSVDDVAEVVTEAVLNRGDNGYQVLEVGGPQDFTRLETLGMLEKALGVKAKTRHVPLAAMRVMRTAVRPFNPSMSDLVDFSIAENAYPEAFAWKPTGRKIVGPTALQAVIERWAGPAAH